MVFYDSQSSPYASVSGDVLGGGKLTFSDAPNQLYNPLQSSALRNSAVPKPTSDVASQEALDGTVKEVTIEATIDGRGIVVPSSPQLQCVCL